jgi:hypothetical protein
MLSPALEILPVDVYTGLAVKTARQARTFTQQKIIRMLKFITDIIPECGLTYNEPNVRNKRIIGGVKAVEGSWPSHVLIVFKYKANLELKKHRVKVLVSHSSSCGGTLIAKDAVITAAHCISKKARVTYNNISYTYKIVENSLYPSLAHMVTVYLGLFDIKDINLGDVYLKNYRVNVKSVIVVSHCYEIIQIILACFVFRLNLTTIFYLSSPQSFSLSL